MQPNIFLRGSLRWEGRVCLDGYDVCDEEPTADQLARPRQVIVPRSNRYRSYNLGVGDQRLFLQLINAREQATGIMGFVREYGLPLPDRCRAAELIEIATHLRRALAAGNEGRPFTPAKMFRWQMAQGRGHGMISPNAVGVGRLRYEVRNGVPDIYLYATNMRTFMWVELLFDLGAGVQIQRCPSCMKEFVPAARGPRPDTCSPKCRQEKWRSENPDRVFHINEARRIKRAKKVRKISGRTSK